MSSAAAPRRIEKLDAVVVNRIAAGEVVHRPASALKELLENALDAGSTAISITCKDGGLKLLQIQDNGHGINKEDFSLVCQRFTTSKLRTFEDLQQIATYGFRGEALASISHVAHLTLTSMTANAPCAYRARFRDGDLVPDPPGSAPEPRPCAGVRGTTVTAEDLFYNVPTRRRALRGPSEEYSKVLEVVTRYAIHFADRSVGFTCRKHGSTAADVHTLPSATARDNVRAVFGAKVAQEVVEVAFDEPLAATDGADGGSAGRVKGKGLVSNATYSRRRGVFIFFINGRLVDCGPLKRAVEAAYADYLPRRTHPFVYLALEMPPQDVDVNVHPTKREVHFLHEDAVVAATAAAIERVLAGGNASRTFYSQTRLNATPTQATATAADADEAAGGGTNGAATPSASRAKGAQSAAQAWGWEEEEEEEEEEGGGAAAQRGADPSVSRASRLAQRAVGGGGDSSTLGQRSLVVGGGGGDDWMGGAALDSVPGPSASRRGKSSSSSINGSGGGSGGCRAASQGRGSGGASQPSAPQRMVRTDARQSASTLDAFVRRGGGRAEASAVQGSGGKGAAAAAAGTHASGPGSGGDGSRMSRKRPRVPPTLASVQELLDAVAQRAHPALTRVLRRHVFVGVVDDRFSLLQCGTKLCVVDHLVLCRELFHQEALRYIGNMPAIQLSPPAPMQQLVEAALAHPLSGWREEDGSRADIAADLVATLVERADMLHEYFALSITPEGMLTTLPQLVEGHTPRGSRLPHFLLRLASDVDWAREKPCLDGVCAQLAAFYASLPTVRESFEGQGADQGGAEAEASQASTPWQPPADDPPPSHPESLHWQLQHALFPAMRTGLAAPRAFADDTTVVQVAALERLYRIFERC